LGAILTYKNAQDLHDDCVYKLAVQRREAGDFSTAAHLFSSVSTYEDAAQQADSCYDAYLADAYQAAKAAYSEKNWQGVVEAVGTLDLNDLGEKYADLKAVWQESAYNYAEALYADKKPYQAYAYYLLLADYKDVSDKKLTRLCYQVIGKWESSKGAQLFFNEDGTCQIEGVNLYYYSRQYLVQTGPNPDEMNTDYQIVTMNKNTLTLKNKKTGKTYRLTRVKE